MQKHNIDINNHEIENAFKDIEEIDPEAKNNRYYNFLKTTFYESEDPGERGYIFPSINELKIEKKINESEYKSKITIRDFELKRSGLLYYIIMDREEIKKNGERILKLYNNKNNDVIKSNLPMNIDNTRHIIENNDDNNALKMDDNDLYGFNMKNDANVALNNGNVNIFDKKNKKRRWFHGRRKQ